MMRRITKTSLFLALLLVAVTPAALAEAANKPGWSLDSPAASMLKTLGSKPSIDDRKLFGVYDHRSTRHSAERFIELIDFATQGEIWQTDSDCQSKHHDKRPELCKLRWRNNDALSVFRAGYQETINGVKRSLVGETLARHLELDLDSSPEIRIRWEFE